MPWQLSGNGRSGWSTKLIRGLKAEAAAGFQSRRERCCEPAPVTPQYAAFPTYKAARVGGAAAAWPVTTLAQQAERSITRPRVAFLGAESQSTNQHFFDAFRQGMTEHGYIDGQNVILEQRWAEGRSERAFMSVVDRCC